MNHMRIFLFPKANVSFVSFGLNKAIRFKYTFMQVMCKDNIKFLGCVMIFLARSIFPAI